MVKLCSSCKQEKPKEEFYKNSSTKDGFQTICKICSVHMNNLWKMNNKERFNQYSAKWKKLNKDKVADQKKRYSTKHSHAVSAAVSKHIAKKKKATTIWANDFFIKEAYHLAKLRSISTGFKWHVDHIVPINGKTVCGLHCEQNLQVIPAMQNLYKSNKLLV